MTQFIRGTHDKCFDGCPDFTYDSENNGSDFGFWKNFSDRSERHKTTKSVNLSPEPNTVVYLCRGAEIKDPGLVTVLEKGLRFPLLVSGQLDV